jgi:cytidylate kinase
MFRAVALAAMERGLIATDQAAINTLVADLEVMLPPDRVLLNGRDISQSIGNPQVALFASAIASIPAVRARLADWQRAFARDYHTVAEGRDLGTVIFPDAQVKFFLEAKLSECARRRHAELVQRGAAVSLEQVLEDMERRNRQDIERDCAPLVAAPDAIRIDTTDLNPSQVVERMLAELRARGILPIDHADGPTS